MTLHERNEQEGVMTDIQPEHVLDGVSVRSRPTY